MALMDANLMMDGARCDVGAGSHDTCSLDGLRSWGIVGLKGGESASLGVGDGLQLEPQRYQRTKEPIFT